MCSWSLFQNQVQKVHSNSMGILLTQWSNFDKNIRVAQTRLLLQRTTTRGYQCISIHDLDQA
jgi:hypothetical protein